MSKEFNYAVIVYIMAATSCYKSINYKIGLSALWHFNTIANNTIYTVSLLTIEATHFKAGFWVLTAYGTAHM